VKIFFKPFPFQLNIILFLAINAWLMFAYVTGIHAEISEENGALENVQATILGFAFLLFISRLVDPDPRRRVLAIILSFFAFSFFFREVDLRQVDVPSWIILLTSGDIRDYIFITLLSVLIGFLVWKWRTIPSVLQSIFERHAIPFYAALILLALSVLIDKNVIGSGASDFLEETVEINAYIILLLATHWPATR
jgi:hypothetical protein